MKGHLLCLTALLAAAAVASAVGLAGDGASAATRAAEARMLRPASPHDRIFRAAFGNTAFAGRERGKRIRARVGEARKHLLTERCTTELDALAAEAHGDSMTAAAAPSLFKSREIDLRKQIAALRARLARLKAHRHAVTDIFHLRHSAIGHELGDYNEQLRKFDAMATRETRVMDGGEPLPEEVEAVKAKEAALYKLHAEKTAELEENAQRHHGIQSALDAVQSRLQTKLDELLRRLDSLQAAERGEKPAAAQIATRTHAYSQVEALLRSLCQMPLPQLDAFADDGDDSDGDDAVMSDVPPVEHAVDAVAVQNRSMEHVVTSSTAATVEDTTQFDDEHKKAGDARDAGELSYTREYEEMLAKVRQTVVGGHAARKAAAQAAAIEREEEEEMDAEAEAAGVEAAEDVVVEDGSEALSAEDAIEEAVGGDGDDGDGDAADGGDDEDGDVEVEDDE
eukprot:PLAT15321.1.p1 GENE.PLAT15321.1~~PLAT15321.1.p1  ORF type:complete len:453 (-),score=287.96 PLAT15321.1:87-1445(-)